MVCAYFQVNRDTESVTCEWYLTDSVLTAAVLLDSTATFHFLGRTVRTVCCDKQVHTNCFYRTN